MNAPIRQTAPRPKAQAKRRTGPRPLPLYLGLAHMLWLSLPAVSQSLKSALLNSKEMQAAEKMLPPQLREEKKRLNLIFAKFLKQDKNAAAGFDAAIHKMAQRRYGLFLDGVMRYRASPIARAVKEAKTVWRQGTARLLDFSRSSRSKKPVVLVIPSLINRYHVLDLDTQQSFMRGLAASGFSPLLMDWGVPGEEEKTFGFDTVMQKRLIPALQFAAKHAGGKVHVIGYCMGGLLAAALATHRPEFIRSLIFLATPWNFHSDKVQVNRVDQMLPRIEDVLAQQGVLPVDVLQCFFISLQPFVLLDKFLRFAARKKGSREERSFVLIEDWVNEGVPLAANIARECLRGWYVENAPYLGMWKVLCKTIRPEKIHIPNLHVIPQNDKIVPPDSARALAAAMPDAKILQPEFGHISMLVNAAARDKLWPRLFDWLASH